MNDTEDQPDDGASVMREILSQAFWSMRYHERELPKAHREAAMMHALLERAGLLMTHEEAKEIWDTLDSADDAENVRQFAAWHLSAALTTIEYHEAELSKAHGKLAMAKTLMRRAGLELPLAEIESEVPADGDA